LQLKLKLNQAPKDAFEAKYFNFQIEAKYYRDARLKKPNRLMYKLKPVPLLCVVCNANAAVSIS
jgi:hypothetical protein